MVPDLQTKKATPVSAIFHPKMNRFIYTLLMICLTQGTNALAQMPVQVDNFQNAPVNGLPPGWSVIENDRFVPLEARHLEAGRSISVLSEGNNRFVRLGTQNRWFRILMQNGTSRLDWNILTHPRLQWRWRARVLPEGAQETRRNLNDTGGAVYVFFASDTFGRPRSIKYTYSTTLPVGTTFSQGPLRGVVVSTGNDGIGTWRTIERDVLADYRRLFRAEPPGQPQAIVLWGDSDSLSSSSEVDFDDIVLLPAR